MSFYEFLWQAVKRPELLVEYAGRADMRIEVSAEADFYDRLSRSPCWP